MEQEAIELNRVYCDKTQKLIEDFKSYLWSKTIPMEFANQKPIFGNHNTKLNINKTQIHSLLIYIKYNVSNLFLN